MIEDEIYDKVLSSGLILDHWILLCQLSKGEKPIANRRIQGFLNLLIKKEYIKDDALTPKAIELIGTCEPVKEKVSELVVDFQTWLGDLHRKCQDKLFDLTGKKQIRPNIKGTTYSFLPNATDLGRALSRVILVYKTRDFEAMENAILKYIELKHKENSWFPLLQYYIVKDGQSRMYTDMQTPKEEDKPINENLIDPKSLF